MSLHIEIDGGATRREWAAVSVIALVMAGEDAAAAELARTLATGAELRTAPPIARAPGAPMPSAAPVVPATPAEAAEALMALASATRVQPDTSGTEQVGGEPLPEGSAELPAVPVNTAELDSNGMPHDNRIHAATKTKNKDGSWRNLRGVDPELVKVVEAELRAIMAAPVVTPADIAAGAVPPPPVPEVSTGPVMTDPAAAFGGNATAPVVPAPPATPDIGGAPPVTTGPAATPAASPSSEVPAAGEVNEFARIMRVVVAKKLPADFTKGLAMQLGLTGVPDLAKRPDLIPAFEALLP